MKLYLKLAIDSIRKNRRLYMPYILAGGVMAMIFYILGALSATPMLRHFKGGGMLRELLPLGMWIVALFALIFLFYCSSFIIRQRNREFGLYSVLGMNRKNLSLLVLTENLITAGAAIILGLLLGIALEKLAEMGMVRLLGEEATYEFRLDGAAMLQTAAVFAGMYLLLMLRVVARVWRTDPLQLLQSAAVGEKPPRANWFFALAGMVLLVWAYSMAVSIQQPMEALITFFAAVAMVIAATYLLFIAGSVALCRLLQRNKRYYYKANHFISVSTMVYRMKRNGAGLASICILLTVVLVMLSAVLSLYIGAEDSLLSRYPYDVTIEASIGEWAQMTEENFAARRTLLNELVPNQQHVQECIRGVTHGMFTADGVILDPYTLEDVSQLNMASIGTLQVISLADYNRMTGGQLSLAEDECLLLCWRTSYAGSTFTLQGGPILTVSSVEESLPLVVDAETNLYPTITLVTPDFEGVISHLTIDNASTTLGAISLFWHYSFDLPGGADAQLALYDPLMNHMRELAFPRETGGYSYNLSIREIERIDFYGMYGGLFFIGVMLSIVFIAAAVLIIYYKQLSEGYEDQKRFAILQKVGMTKKEIRQSVNSQVLTVFFAPLLMAGLHLAFAFPLVWKLLMLFHLSNMGLMVVVTACSFAVFGVLYAVVYKITSNAYFAIVSGKQGNS